MQTTPLRGGYDLEYFENVSAEKQADKIKNPDNIPSCKKAEEGAKNMSVRDSLNDSKNRSKQNTKNKADKSVQSEIIFL